MNRAAQRKKKCAMSIPDAHYTSSDDPPVFRLIHLEDGPSDIGHLYLIEACLIRHVSVLFFNMSGLPLGALDHDHPRWLPE